MIYDIDKMADCVNTWLQKNNIEPEILSLTLSFGMSKKLNIIIPELLIGIVSKEDIDKWKEEGDLVDYVWNQAEYTYFEIEQECINKSLHFPTEVEMNRKYFIDSLMDNKCLLFSKIYEDSNFTPYIYVHDLDNQDVQNIISDNFSSYEIRKLTENGLL